MRVTNTYVGDKDKACTGKATFPTKRRAKLELRRLHYGGKRGMRAYRCSWCGGFHIGHAS